MLGLTIEDIGVTVLSSIVATNMAVLDSRLCILGINPTIERKTHLAIQKNINISPVLKVFVKYTTQWIKSFENLKLNT